MDKAIVHLYGEISSVAYIGGGAAVLLPPLGNTKLKGNKL